MRRRPGRRLPSTISASDLSIHWKVFDVGEQRRRGVLCRQRRLFDAPFDVNRRIVTADRNLVLRTIKLVTFVEEIGGLGEHDKAMGEAAGHPQLSMVFLAQFNSNMTPKIWAADAHVDGYIKDLAA